MKNLVFLLALSITTPLSALAFLGMNAGATLQGPLPAWTKQIGARTVKASTSSYGVATDSSGNIIVAGSTTGDLDGNTLTGGSDFFVTKYNSSGTKLWTRQLGVTSKSTVANTVATDSSGNIFVAGDTNGGLDGNTLTGTQDFFVTKYDSTGTKLWTRQLGIASKSVNGYGVATDSSGNVFVAGVTTGGLDGNTLTGWQDFYVTKYNSAGVKQWTKQLGKASSLTTGRAVATDSSGNIFVTGDTTGGLDGNTLTGSSDYFVTKYDSTGAKVWTKQLGVASKYTYGKGVATDSSGNIFVAGYTLGGLAGNTLTGTQDFFVSKYDSTGTRVWTKQLGVASHVTNANGVATDSSGNIYVSGYTDGGLDGNTLTGTTGFFVTKYDSTGSKLWTRQLGVASSTTYSYGVAADSSGNCFAAGFTQGGLDGNTLTGTRDFFVTKYDSTGAKTWTNQLGGLAPTNVAITASTLDSSGNLYITGTTNGGLDGNTQTGFSDFFVSKYDSTGVKQWTKQLGGNSAHVWSNAIATDSSGNVFIAGYTDTGLDGNTQTGAYDFFVTKYDSTGAKIWTRQLGVASQSTYGYGVATDSSGNIYVAGYTTGGLDGNTLTGSQDLFITKYNSAGVKQWTKQLGAASAYVAVYAAATDSSGNIFVTGYADHGLDGNTQTGTYDFFVTKYDSTGVKVWTKQMGVASKNTWANGVATDSSGNIFVTGITFGGLDGNTLTGTKDFFVTKYDSTGAKVWTRQLGVASKNTSGYSVSADSTGNIYVAGSTTGGLDGNVLAGTQDFFATKYTSAGVRQWTKQMGVASKSTSAASVAIDSKGQLYASGTTTGGLDFNALIGSADSFVCQYIGN
jgi:uncharacterized delta-60 repeat protein